MANREQILCNKPHRLVRGHPVHAVKPSQIYRIRKRPQRSLPPQVEVGIEIAHRQLAQAAINRLAISTACVIRIRNRSPVPVLLEHGDHMVRIVLSFQINDQRRIPVRPQCCRCEQRPLIAMRCIFPQHSPRRPRRVRQMIRLLIQKPLNSVRIFQAPQLPQFGGSEAPM